MNKQLTANEREALLWAWGLVGVRRFTDPDWLALKLLNINTLANRAGDSKIP